MHFMEKNISKILNSEISQIEPSTIMIFIKSINVFKIFGKFKYEDL